MKRDSGETLIEVLMTVIVLGIGGVGLIGAMATLVTSNEAHRRLGDTEVTTRQYAEAVEQKWLTRATTTLTTSVGPYDVNDTVTLKVASAAGFPTSNHTVAIAGELFSVQGGHGTSTWTGKALAAGSVGTGAVVQAYSSCPSAAELAPTVAVTGDRIGTPSLRTTIEYFNASGDPVSDCPNYWKSLATVCGNSGSQEHLSTCDPALIRATVETKSTDAGSTGAATSTQVLLRRAG